MNTRDFAGRGGISHRQCKDNGFMKGLILKAMKATKSEFHSVIGC